MNRQEQFEFYACIGKEYRAAFENNGIPLISKEHIREHKAGKRFLYSISNKAYNNIHLSLIENLFSKIPLNNAATAFRPNRSYLNFLEPHLNGYYFLRLDIKNFFHSISLELLTESFSDTFKEKFVDKKEKQQTISGLIDLITYKIPEDSINTVFRGRQIVPMGFKTSPVISNIIFRKIDILIQKYCASKNVTYSRYADDLLFSATKQSKFVHSDSFEREIEFLLSINKFKLNQKKTLKACHTISLNGYVIENPSIPGVAGHIRISNKKTKIIDKLNQRLTKEKSAKSINMNAEKIMQQIFNFKATKHEFREPTPGFIQQYCRDQLFNKATGYRAYLISLLQFQNQYQCIDTKAINKYSQQITNLNKHISKMVTS
jgi:RNA-directed DNA polymerase